MTDPSPDDNVGVVCGQCDGGPVYFETCETNRGNEGHHSALASECQSCGARYEITDRCDDCGNPRDGDDGDAG